MLRRIKDTNSNAMQCLNRGYCCNISIVAIKLSFKVLLQNLFLHNLLPCSQQITVTHGIKLNEGGKGKILQ